MYVSNNWQKMFDAGLGTSHKVIPVNLGTDATVVEVKKRETDHYGEYYQGDDEVYIIFQVGDRFFKKTGTMDSYDEDFSWDGPVVEVFGSTKTVTVFVPK
jgi:hypothetical protein